MTADGGPSGLGSATLAGADGGTVAVANGAVATVSSDGGHTLRLDAVDGAGNAAVATATVNVDRTAPARRPVVRRLERRSYACRVDASDAASGLAALAGASTAAPSRPIAAGGTLHRRQGQGPPARRRRRRQRDDHRRRSRWPRSRPAAKVRISERPGLPRRQEGHRQHARRAERRPQRRPARCRSTCGRWPSAAGRYRVEIALKSGKHAKKVKRTYKVGRTGALPRISASLSKATEKCTITLTVRKKVGKRWRKHAGTRLVLAK